MPYGNLNIKDPGSENHYLWKYLDLHRLIYFLSRQSLLFTRLDVFKDPFEGVRTSTLRRIFAFKDAPDEGGQPELPSVRKRAFDYSQRKQYVNSWFYGERESMAMWNLYSNPDSVALRIAFDDLAPPLERSFQRCIEEHNGHISVIGDRIRYFKLNPFDEEQRIRLRFSGFRKDISFEHEKEYRFLIYTNPVYAKRNELTFVVKIDGFADLPFTIVAHPLMEEWKLRNIAELLKAFRLDFGLKPSDILLKK